MNATAHFQQALQHHQAGEWPLAEPLYRQALDEDFAFAEAWHLWGVLCHQTGRHDLALKYIRRAIHLDDRQASFHYNLAVVLQHLQAVDEAAIHYRHTLDLDPTFTSAVINYGNQLVAAGQFCEAVQRYEAALERQTNSRLHAALAPILKMTGDISAARRHHAAALQAEPSNPHYLSQELFTLQYDPTVTAEGLFERHREWGASVEEREAPAPPAPAPSGPFRIGFVSPDFGNHPVGIFLAPLLEQLRETDVQTVCFSHRKEYDEYTARIRASVDEWHELRDLNVAEAQSFIERHPVNVLFDLAGHTEQNRLGIFTRKLAARQVTWLGYVGTTGLSTIDDLLCDAFHMPETGTAQCVERPLRMPHGYVPYEPPNYAPDIVPPPCEINHYVTFGCFNNPAKINNAVLTVWSRILERIPKSRLTLKYKGFTDKSVQERIRSCLGEQGIESSRVELIGGTKHGDHLAAYQKIDISLDPFPYSGGLTTLESVWMGVPVVTFPGERFASRHAYSHLKNCDVPRLESLIAEDLTEYVELAVKLASEVDQLYELRSLLRPRMQAAPVCDVPQFSRDFLQLLSE